MGKSTISMGHLQKDPGISITVGEGQLWNDHNNQPMEPKGSQETELGDYEEGALHWDMGSMHQWLISHNGLFKIVKKMFKTVGGCLRQLSSNHPAVDC